MSRVRIKICGLNSRRAVEAAVASGADALGFVFSVSPRRVTPAEAASLTADLGGRVARVAVFRHAGREQLETMRSAFDPELVQADFGEVPAGGGWLPVFRDTAPGRAALRAYLRGMAPRRPRLLFEGARSGGGVRVDWARAAELASEARLILAGGLTPDNVVEAIRRVRPFGVDVSSGVESRPGLKDEARIRAFCAAVREEQP